MRIAIFTDTFLPTYDGVVNSILNLTKRLSEKGHEFLIICPDFGKPEGTYEGNVRILRVPSLALPNYKNCRVVLPLYRTCISAVKEFKPDMIHLETFSTLGWMAVKCAKDLKLPLIGTYHTVVAELLTCISPWNILGIDKLAKRFIQFKPDIEPKDTLQKRIVWKLSIKLYSHCDFIIAPSETLKNELAKRGLKNVRTISNGIDLSLFPKSKTFPKKIRRFLHVGRISYEKRADILLYALKEAILTVPEIHLTVIGDGPAMGSLKSLTATLGLANNVSFEGYQPIPKNLTYHKQSDVFITASPMETQGLAILEALACGLPAIGVDRYAVPDVIKHNKNGYIAQEPYVSNLAQYMVKMAQAKSLLKMSKSSFDIAKTHEIGKCTDQLEQAYRDTIKLNLRKRVIRKQV